MPDRTSVSDRSLMHELVNGCVTGLVANLSTEPPSLRDPVRKQPTPTNHYAHCSLALALRICRPDSKEWESALAAYVAIPRRKLGHGPFNRLLLLLMEHEQLSSNDSRGLVRTALERSTISTRYPSNNWSLLAQACRVLETARGSSDRQRETAEYEAMVTRWMTKAGGFIDYPANPRGRSGATPLAYHHKALFLTTIVVLYADTAQLSHTLQALLDWSLQWIDQGGLCGGFGRTNHGLFGDACLLASLIMLRRSKAIESSGLEGAMSRILTRLGQQRRSDGLIWLTPARGDGWDSYMFLSVYNAWFAAIGAWAGVARVASPCPLEWRPALTGLFADDSAGLAVWRAPTQAGLIEAMLSTTGQPPQGFAATQAELRYAGGRIFSLSSARRPLIPPPIRLSVQALRQTPALAGWTPIFEHEHQLFGLVDLSVKQLCSNNERLLLELEGRPTAISADAHRKGFLSSLLDALDWRLFGSRLARRRALQRSHLDLVHCVLRLEITGEDASIQQDLSLTVRTPTGVSYLNPRGWAVCKNGSSSREGLTYPCSLPNSVCGSDERLILAEGDHRFTIRIQL